MHATLEKFGAPDTVLSETDHWVLVLRPVQVTFGSLVLIHKGPATSLGDVPAEAMTEFPYLCAAAEACLKAKFGAQKFNYLALMMVDPQVHFHVLPRYDAPVSYNGTNYGDPAFPGPADITSNLNMTPDGFDALLADLKHALNISQ